MQRGICRIIVVALIVGLSGVPVARAEDVPVAATASAARTGYSDQWFGRNLVQLWSYPAGSAVYSPPVTDGRAIYAGSDGGRFFALDPATGAELWSYEVGSAIKDPACLAGDRVYFTTLRGDVNALATADGTPIWKAELRERIDAGVAATGDRIVVPCSDGIVRGLSALDGTTVWQYTIGVGTRLLSTPAITDGVVLIEADDSLTALEPLTGSLLWHVPLSGEFRHWPVIAGDRVITAGSGDSQGGLKAVRIATGEELGGYKYPGDNHWAAPAIDPSDGSVYAGLEGGVFRFSSQLGSPVARWDGKPEAKSGSKRYVMWQPLILRDLIVVPGHLEVSAADALFFFSRDGSLSFLGVQPLPEKLAAPPLVYESVLYYGSVSGNLVALAPVRVRLNGSLVDFGQKQPLSQPSGRVIVPARAVVEGAGGTIDWDPVARVATARFNGHVVAMPIDSSTIIVDGVPETIDEPARLIDGSTMLPIRWMVEGLGGEVGWDQPTRTVIITLVAGQ
ncbi:MAG: PQQ-binding-like beta-propeller repeat protein [Chloroflexota bacterium]